MLVVQACDGITKTGLEPPYKPTAASGRPVAQENRLGELGLSSEPGLASAM
jgi:hypothetical protein